MAAAPKTPVRTLLSTAIAYVSQKRPAVFLSECVAAIGAEHETRPIGAVQAGRDVSVGPTADRPEAEPGIGRQRLRVLNHAVQRPDGVRESGLPRRASADQIRTARRRRERSAAAIAARLLVQYADDPVQHAERVPRAVHDRVIRGPGRREGIDVRRRWRVSRATPGTPITVAPTT